MPQARRVPVFLGVGVDTDGNMAAGERRDHRVAVTASVPVSSPSHVASGRATD
jgi:hypothetical protein